MPAVNLTQMNTHEIINKVVELGGDGVVKCIQCGACASICPVSHAGFPLFCKQLIRKVQTGHEEEILDDPSTWACVACNRCVEVCPRGVNPTEVVFAFRRIQANELAVSTSSLMSQSNLYEKGHAVLSNDAKKLRTKVGLPENPPTSVNDEKAQKEIQTLLDNSPMADLGIF